MNPRLVPVPVLLALALGACSQVRDLPVPQAMIYNPGKLKPVDSRLVVQAGDQAPEFKLPGLSGHTVSLAQFRGRKNVVLSFVPSAFTPVCSAQWPGYSLAYDLLEQRNAVMLGITTDHLASLHAWTNLMGGLRFEALSDFWPHGRVAKAYGVLRGDGTTERALIVIDQQGVIRWIDVHDINERPPLEELVAALDRIR
jgi:peroxiredoxin (alkyl hydroperoxide reductase subunit C)